MIGPNPAARWGAGRGPLGAVSAGPRLLAWLLLLAALLVARPLVLPELALALIALLLWSLAAGTPLRTLRVLAGLGLVLFLPFFLFLPWTGRGEVIATIGPLALRSDAWVAPGTVLFRGVGCLILGAGVLAGFTEEEFHRAVVRLPLPRLVRIMIVQIVRFLAPLAHEAVGISRAVLVRGGGSGGRGAVQIARALPAAWLPRVLDRSVRVSHAMEVRGYTGQLFDPEPPTRGPAARDLTAVIAAGLFPAAVIAMRIISP